MGSSFNHPPPSGSTPTSLPKTRWTRRDHDGKTAALWTIELFCPRELPQRGFSEGVAIQPRPRPDPDPSVEEIPQACLHFLSQAQVHNSERLGANTFWQHRSTPRHQASQAAHRSSKRRSSPLKHEQVRGNNSTSRIHGRGDHLSVALALRRSSEMALKYTPLRPCAGYFHNTRRLLDAVARPRTLATCRGRCFSTRGANTSHSWPYQRAGCDGHSRRSWYVQILVATSREALHTKSSAAPDYCTGPSSFSSAGLSSGSLVWGLTTEMAGPGPAASSQIWSCSSAESLGKSGKLVVAIFDPGFGVARQGTGKCSTHPLFALFEGFSAISQANTAEKRSITLLLGAPPQFSTETHSSDGSWHAKAVRKDPSSASGLF